MSIHKKITICSVGDLMLSDSPLYVGVGVGSAYPQMKGNIFENCKSDFDTADVVIGNLETVVYHPRHNNLAELQMCCSEDIVEELRDSGFSVLNLANNHCLQHGTDGFLYTKKVCDRLGIHGIGLKDEVPSEIEIGECRMFFLSICLHTEWYQPDDIQYEDNIERVIKKIREIHYSNIDSLVVLSVHWGDEFATYPSNEQIKLAHRFADNGVDILLGHHSHVFQGIEKYKNSLIVYGQGNFVSDMVPSMCRETAIVKIFIDIREHEKEIDYELRPYYIADTFIPEKCSDDWFDERQNELARAINGDFSDEDYWRTVRVHHKNCHNDFRTKFINDFFKYKFRISSRMLYEFLLRKVKKIKRN